MLRIGESVGLQLQQLASKPLDHLALAGEIHAPALIDKAGLISFFELDQIVGKMAAWLRAQNLSKGDRVASWGPKSRFTCLMPLACARAGLVHVPINPALKALQAAYILNDSGARLLIAGAARLHNLRDHDVSFMAKTLDEVLVWPEMLAASGAIGPSAYGPDTLAAILYTSGSTGRPKGVMLSHQNMMLGAVSVARYLKLGADDRTLCVLPLAFDYGQNQLLSTWAAGGAVVPFDYLLPRDVVKAVARYEITTLAGVPPLWVQLDEVPWPDEAIAPLRRLTNSGGRLPVSLVQRMRARFPMAELYLMYGLTEAFRSTYLDPALVDQFPDAVGEAIPFAEVRIVRPDGHEADVGEPGELVHGGPLVAQGYWQDEARTAERFRPAPRCMTYQGMAVWSGDTLVRDAAGLLRFVGRDDEMIKVSGNRISPTEIEEAAIASKHVAEAVAFGVADDRLGQSIWLVARPVGGKADEAGLIGWFRREMPSHMVPQRIIWRDEFPRNPNGKLDRVQIRNEVMS